MSLSSLSADSCVRVREEIAGSGDDCAAIRFVNEEAFGSPEEADLVDNLRTSGLVLVSLVAEVEVRLVGPILFSRMWIDAPSGRIPVVALAPMAVVPEQQRRGVGTLLVQCGVEKLREQKEEVVIVVGHPEFYPRFGFSSQQAESIDNPFPREAFMALELRPGTLAGVKGSVAYPPAFGI